MKITKRELFILIIIIYFTFIGGTFYSQLNFLLRLTNQIIVTVILGAWLFAKLKNKTGLPVTTLDWGIGLYLIANLVSAVFGISPRYSLESMWFTLTHILAFYLLIDLVRKGWTMNLTWAFYMAAAVVCLVSLVEFVAWYVGTPVFARFAQGWLEIGGWQQPIPPQIYRLGAAMNGPTPLSAYLALLIPAAITLILTLPVRDDNRKALLIWLVLALIVQIFTFSRAGILALAVSLSLVAAGWWRLKQQGQQLRLKPYWIRLGFVYQGIIIGGALLATTLGLFWLRNSFLNRVHSTNFRLLLWEAATYIFQEHWLTGVGPANFGRALLWFNDATFPRKQIGTAHSIYFNTAAELGLVGLLIGICLYALLVWSWWKRWQQATQSTTQLRLIGCGAALVGLVVQTLVDTYPATPNMLLMLAIIAYVVADLKQPLVSLGHTHQPGTMLGISQKRSLFQRFSPHLYSVFGALALLLIYLTSFIWIARADLYTYRSFRAEGQGNLVEAVAQAATAHKIDPALSLRTFRLALLEARLAYQTDDPARLQAAIQHYQAGLRQDPILGLNSANLAGLLWQQGQRKNAIELLEQTIAVEPDPIYFLNLGYFYEQAGNWDRADHAYGQALRRSPGLAASGFWQASPTRIEKWPGFVGEAVDQIPSNQLWGQKTLRLNLALFHKDYDQIKKLIDSERLATTNAATEVYRNTLADFYLSQAQLEQARIILEPVPNNAQTYLLRGRLELLAGDTVAAEKLLKTAVFLGNQQANYYLGQLFEQRGELQTAAIAYGRGFSYRAVQEDISVNIYGRLGGNDFVPHILRIGIGQPQAEPLLALARLHEDEQRFDEAKRIYSLLLTEDPFFEIARQRLESLEQKGL